MPYHPVLEPGMYPNVGLPTASLWPAVGMHVV